VAVHLSVKLIMRGAKSVGKKVASDRLSVNGCHDPIGKKINEREYVCRNRESNP
jgi:hypothetical protein